VAAPRKLVRPGQPIARRPRRGGAPRPLTPVAAKSASKAAPKLTEEPNLPESEKE